MHSVATRFAVKTSLIETWRALIKFRGNKSQDAKHIRMITYHWHFTCSSSFIMWRDLLNSGVHMMTLQMDFNWHSWSWVKCRLNSQQVWITLISMQMNAIKLDIWLSFYKLPKRRLKICRKYLNISQFALSKWTTQHLWKFTWIYYLISIRMLVSYVFSWNMTLVGQQWVNMEITRHLVSTKYVPADIKCSTSTRPISTHKALLFSQSLTWRHGWNITSH